MKYSYMQKVSDKNILLTFVFDTLEKKYFSRNYKYYQLKKCLILLNIAVSIFLNIT